ncbi:insulinase family protein [Alkalibaculum sp. M08DMB]|uniref:Insulinase family protein n=1 Tax=Alkalibaculum sporogenes TaxID=2655001 RepID=A0A6A7KAK9_9FIRM|nr:insulinase family protein [Alkalibaculum sporogenes]MPW26321.1 insulinase family protein [Alkalibaculum sporogenes]
MNFKIGEIYNGFKLIETKEVKEINSLTLLFEHSKTGAKLFYISNDDNNKVFSISFRTPPQDSTGLPHILEHSVLCGSDKYPIKEPFVELIKGSLNTFLNAMTFPDKTMYPIASMNEKDFINLMDVYLDAVFHPRIYTDKGIFLQEGWHYHLENKEDDIEYVGVVYNEMKGAFSNPEEVVNRKIQESLFPDTPYGKESGGDPEFIIDLTYEDFIDFHKKYYHPSNSYIYLYGDGDILEQLAFLNDNYLEDYDEINMDSSIPIQESFNEPKECEYFYPISNKESLKEKTYLTMNFVTGTSTDAQTHLGMEILTHILLNSPSAPLKKALLDAQLGKDVVGSFDGGILQPVISIMIKNSEEGKKNQLKDIVINTLKSLVKDGIDQEQIKAAINITEFRLREADYGSYPKGLIYGINIMDSWLYDADPTMHLEYEEYISNIRDELENNYFEKIIQKYLIDNNHCSLLIVKPEQGLVDKNDDEIAEKLKSYKETLKEKDLDNLIQETKDLIKNQNTPDKEEDIIKIPVLPIEDIVKESEVLPLELRKYKENEVLYHNINTNGIVYADLLFSINNIKQELIPYIALLARYLGEVSTEKYSFEQLTNEIEINTGGIDYDIDVYGDIKDLESYSPKFIVKGRVLNSNIEKMFELFKEILCNSKYDEKQRLKEIIQSSKAKTEMTFLSVGHKIVANRVHSYYSNSAKFLEYINGIEYYNFIKNLEKNFENQYEEIFSSMEQASKLLFNKKNMIISLTSEEDGYKVFDEKFNILYDNLYNDSINQNIFKFDLNKLNEGLMTSSKVQYVGKAFNIQKLDYKYSGVLQVLKTIISTDYLWNKVRVQGGAYGAFFSIGRAGSLFIGSYRDPNLKNTVNTINRAYEYVENFKTSKREMNKYIIGTISNFDVPMTPWTKGNLATGNYLRNITQEDIQRERDEMLGCNVEDIVNSSKIIKDCIDENYLCVLGNDKKIKGDKDLFENLIDLFE